MDEGESPASSVSECRSVFRSERACVRAYVRACVQAISRACRGTISSRDKRESIRKRNHVTGHEHSHARKVPD